MTKPLILGSASVLVTKVVALLLFWVLHFLILSDGLKNIVQLSQSMGCKHVFPAVSADYIG